MAVRVLFIDEEIPAEVTEGTPQVPPTPYMWYYYHALNEYKSVVDCVVARSADEAMEFLESPNESFDIISIDVLMPGGKTFSNDATANGTRTGLVILKWIIDKELAVSVVLLTNVPTPVVESQVPENLGSVRRLEIVEKMHTTPFQYLDLLLEMGDA